MLETEFLNPVVLPVQTLEETVWNKGICSGCRACISVCLADSLVYDREAGHPTQVNPCVDCRACLVACPRLAENMEKTAFADIIGPYQKIVNVRSKQSYIRQQNGGAASALLAAAIDEELVDCALVMDLDRWSQQPHPRVIYSSKDLEKAAGSKYTSNEILESVKDLVRDPHVKNIALVGTPCSVQAAGLLRRSNNENALKLASKVRFLLGLFCFEAFDSRAIEKIGIFIGEPPWRISKMSAGEGKMTVELRDGRVQRIPLHEIEQFVKPGCAACTDFTAKLSDISLGGIGSAPGMTSAIVRTPEGMGLFKIAEEMGYIESWDGVKAEEIEKVGRVKVKRRGI
jgi:coenzyme F420 hydrogenase subunit beta